MNSGYLSHFHPITSIKYIETQEKMPILTPPRTMSPWDSSASPCPVQLCSRLLSFTLLACFGVFAVGGRKIAEPPDVWKIRAAGFVARAWEGGKRSDRQRYQAPGSAAGPQPFCLPHQRKGFPPLLIKLINSGSLREGCLQHPEMPKQNS